MRIINNFKLAATNTDALKVMELTYFIEMFDKYKNSVGGVPALEISFDAREAIKYSFDNAYEFDLINVACLKSVHPAMASARSDYCARSGEFSCYFCSQLRQCNARSERNGVK